MEKERKNEREKGLTQKGAGKRKSESVFRKRKKRDEERREKNTELKWGKKFKLEKGRKNVKGIVRRGKMNQCIERGKKR